MSQLKFQEMTDYEHYLCSVFSNELQRRCILQTGRPVQVTREDNIYIFRMGNKIIVLGKINGEISFVEKVV